MCLALYVITDITIENSKYDKNNPSMYIEDIDPVREKGVLKWRGGKRNCYYIGSSQGCGCGWAASEDKEDTEDYNTRVKDRKDLYNLLSKPGFRGSYLITCWDGEDWKDLAGEETLNIENIKDAGFPFKELIRYTLE